ncbi:MAG: hypothetical protein OHK0046_25530 [Anaerolineae bacterium]
MDLEQRVKALEQEVQILKNEIQATLLAMQEHLLNQAHPTLNGRSSAAPGPEAPQAAQPASPSIPSPISAPAPSIPAPAQPMTYQDEGDDEAAPVVRKVSLEDIERRKAAPTPPSRPAPARQPARKNTPPAAMPAMEETQDTLDMRWATQPQLEEWARRVAAKHGIERARQMIDARLAQGKMPQEAHDLLQDYVNRLEDMQRATLARQPQRDPEPPGKPGTRQTEEEVMPQRSSTVLRLIAGVANASAGVRWNKKQNG